MKIAELQKIEETMRREYANLSGRGADIRRKPGRVDKESNFEIECAIELFDEGSLSIREFLLTIAAKSTDPVIRDSEFIDAVSITLVFVIGR